MESTRKRNIQNGATYDRLFPIAEGGVHTVKKSATLPDTLVLIPKVVHKTLSQTKQIAGVLKGESLYQTCNNIWDFVYRHIQYKKDKQGYEQIRSPARAWHDRRTGVDCDCYTVFISSILTNLGIPHILRITKYSSGFFQHIYPVVPYKDGKYIIIDCVTNQFDYEVPYSEKKDYPMELQYLSGFDNNLPIDDADDGMAELGKLIKRSMANAGKKPASFAKKASRIAVKGTLPGAAKTGGKLFKKLKAKSSKKKEEAASSQPSNASPKPKKKKFIGKVLNKINKINPATILLRNGIIAAMKLNIKNVAKRLRWSYLTQEQAAQKGIEPAKFTRLVSVRQKLENIFYGAGGKPDNLKKAILGGKGNKDKAVNGLGFIDMYGVDYLNINTPLQQLLGPEIYYSENIAGMEEFQGFGALGEPVTLTSVGAAMGVVASIVASLKQVGNIFKGKENGAEDFDESKTDNPDDETDSSSPPPAPVVQQSLPPADNSGDADESANEEPNASSSDEPEQPETGEEEQPDEAPENEAAEEVTQSMAVQQVSEDEPEASPEESVTDGFGSTGDKQSFWQRNKGWIKPVAIGAGGIGLIILLSKLMKDAKPHHHTKGHALSGPPKGKGRRNNYQRNSKSTRHKKKAVALM